MEPLAKEAIRVVNDGTIKFVPERDVYKRQHMYGVRPLRRETYMFSNEAFAQNAEKYMDMVFRVAYGWLKNSDDANDVTQDVLIELYKTDKAFESDAHRCV